MGLLGGGDDAEPVHIGGRALPCQGCGHARFRRRRAQLNTAWASFYSLDWLNRSAECHVCDQCSYVHWFLPR